MYTADNMLSKKEKIIIGALWLLFVLWSSVGFFQLTSTVQYNPWAGINYFISIVLVVVFILAPVSLGFVAKARHRIRPSKSLKFTSTVLLNAAWVIPVVYIAFIVTNGILRGAKYSEYYAENKREAEQNRVLQKVKFLNDQRQWYVTEPKVVLGDDGKSIATLTSRKYYVDKHMQDRIDYRVFRGMSNSSDAGILESKYELNSNDPWKTEIVVKQIQGEEFGLGKCTGQLRCEELATLLGTMECMAYSSTSQCRIDIDNQSLVVNTEPSLESERIILFINALQAKGSADVEPVEIN